MKQTKEKQSCRKGTATYLCATICSVLAFGLPLNSCSKALDSVSEQEDGIIVKLNLNVFSIEQIPFSQCVTRGGAYPASVCSKISYAVYSGTGDNMTKQQKNQDSGDSDFGTVSFNLEEGTYKIVVIAHNGDGNPTMTSPSKITFNNKEGLKMTDTYLYCADVTVTPENHELQLELERIVAKFQLHLEDSAIPDEVTQLKFEYSGGSSTLDALTGKGCVASKQSETIDCRDGVYDYSVYTFIRDDSNTLKVKVSALNSSGEVLKEKDFADVPISLNYITKYSGQMFDKAILSSAFEIVIDNEWAGTVDRTF